MCCVEKTRFHGAGPRTISAQTGPFLSIFGVHHDCLFSRGSGEYRGKVHDLL